MLPKEIEQQTPDCELEQVKVYHSLYIEFLPVAQVAKNRGVSESAIYAMLNRFFKNPKYRHLKPSPEDWGDQAEKIKSSQKKELLGKYDLREFFDKNDENQGYRISQKKDL